MNEIERAKQAKLLVADVEGQIDPDCIAKDNAVKMKLALMYLIEKELNVEREYTRRDKW